MKDMVALVADNTMKITLQQLLDRKESFGIRHINTDIYAHPNRDPGLLNEAGNFLNSFVDSYKYALVMFDREGCGQEKKSVQKLESIVQKQLNETGWENRSCVVVIEPELEVWVWTDSPHVSSVLGVTYKSLKKLLSDNAITSNYKPLNPKELMEEILFRSRIPRSSSLYAKLAKNVSLKNCSDPAFCRLSKYLTSWFGLDE